MQKLPWFQQLTRWLGSLGLSALLLSACAIEGGVERATEVPPTPTNNAEAAATALAEAQAVRDDTWYVGLLDEPSSLLPYAESASAERIAAPITELLFPSPVLSYNYTYSSTGVLERIPSLENGDVEIKQIDVYLDPTGVITNTQTDVITQVEQLVVTFHWNPELTWSDGTPVTAADSVFAYELAQQTNLGEAARGKLERTLNYEELDTHTTRATLYADLTDPTYFLNYWTPLPKHILQNTSIDELASGPFAYKPIGYGPYQIEQRSPREITLSRNPHYFGQEANNSQMVFVFDTLDNLYEGIERGTLDIVATDRVPSDQFARFDQLANDGIQVSYQEMPIWAHLDFNLDIPSLQDYRLRRAIATGTNRQQMINELFGGHGQVLESWVLPAQKEAASLDEIARYPYDPEAANTMLEEAGYTLNEEGVRVDSDGVPLQFQLLTSENESYPVLQRAAEIFQANMQDLGIQIEVVSMPSNQLFALDGPLFQRQFEFVLFAWLASSDPGGLPLWSCNAVPSEQNGFAGNNFAGWCFRDANRAIRIAVTALNAEERQAAYLEHQQKLAQEVPIIPLFQRVSLTLVRPDLQGVSPDPLAPITWNAANWQRSK
jgi:peptide/nickel transport system substrate-binding protein